MILSNGFISDYFVLLGNKIPLSNVETPISISKTILAKAVNGFLEAAYMQNVALNK